MKTIEIEVSYKRGVQRKVITYSASATHEETAVEAVYKNIKLAGWKITSVTVVRNDFQKE